MGTKCVPLVDKTLNLNEQSWKLLHVLDSQDIEVPDLCDIRTSAWYNGRERGFCITLFRYVTPKAFHITWAENRNSDALVINWFQNSNCFNPPTPADIKDEEWKENRKFFDYGKYDEAAEFILQKLVSTATAISFQNDA